MNTIANLISQGARVDINPTSNRNILDLRVTRGMQSFEFQVQLSDSIDEDRIKRFGNFDERDFPDMPNFQRMQAAVLSNLS